MSEPFAIGISSPLRKTCKITAPNPTSRSDFRGRSGLLCVKTLIHYFAGTGQVQMRLPTIDVDTGQAFMLVNGQVSSGFRVQ